MKKKIFAIIFALFCCVSVFGVFSMTNRDAVSYADEIVSQSSYVGSELNYPLSFGVSDSNSHVYVGQSADCLLFNSSIKLKFYYDNSGKFVIKLFYSFFAQSVIGSSVSSDNSHLYHAVGSCSDYDGSFEFTHIDLSSFSGSSLREGYTAYIYNDGISPGSSPIFDVYGFLGKYLAARFYLYVYKPSDVSSLPDPSNLQDFCIGNYDDGFYGSRISQMGGYYNYLRYEFSDGYSVTIGLPSNIYNSVGNTTGLIPVQPLSFRRYYFNPSTDLTDNAIYQQGVADGNAIGYNDGQQYGYNLGYDQGRSVGYASGYNEGLAQTDYSFFDLFGSVIDAPVHVLTGLFNFELLGVNLWTLFTGLFTLAFVLWILKLVLGGK